MALHLRLIDTEPVWEIGDKRLLEPRIIWCIGCDERRVQLQLAIGGKDRQLGPRQTTTGAAEFRNVLGIRQPLDLAVQSTFALQQTHEAGMCAQFYRRLRLLQGQAQGLGVVVRQHMGRDIVGHAGQQRVPGRPIQLAGAFKLSGKDLDVHLVVGGVHAGGIINGVSIDASAIAGEGDPAGLCEAQIGAFTHHLASEFRRIDADGVIGLVAGVCMALGGGFHIGSDAAQIQQLHPGLENGPDQVQGRQLVVLQVQHSLHLGADVEGLGVAREDPAAFRDQLGPVVRPGRPRQGEHTIAFLP